MSIVSVSSSSTCLRSAIQSQRHGSKLNLSHLLHRTQSLPFPRTNPQNRSYHITTPRDMAIYSDNDLGSPLPPPPHTPWPLWVAGVLLPAILSVLKRKNYWRPFLMFKQKVDKVVHVAEDVAEMVETAAEGVDKAAEEIAELLPEGRILQKAAILVENTAEAIAKDADFAGDIIDKVEKMEDGLSSFIKQNGESKEEDAKQKNGQN